MPANKTTDQIYDALDHVQKEGPYELRMLCIHLSDAWHDATAGNHESTHANLHDALPYIQGLRNGLRDCERLLCKAKKAAAKAAREQGIEVE